ncbi:MAG: PA14 domain-containing protein [Verrucomicrobia subdivision 3 bacterium]|nr:PA14 domain-containing protein [Limisphaerales bacterium]
MSNLSKNFTAFASALVLSYATLAQSADIHVPGFLKFEVYTNIPGVAVSDLTSSPDYPNSPGRVFYMPSFDTLTVYPVDTRDNFGGRLSGFITPTESGDYEFFLRSDDASQLFLSLDDTVGNLQLIAEETTCCGPFEEPGAPETSFPTPLVAGQRYAVQVLYKEGMGGDLCQVAWRKVGDTTPAAQLTPIPIAFLSTLIAPLGSITITQQPANVTAGENETITLSVGFNATHAPAVVQWQRNGTNVAGLTGSTLKLGPLAMTDAGNYRAVISIPGATTNSAEVMVTVNADVTPPTIRSVVGSASFDMLTVEFSEPIFPETLGEVLNYTIGGLTVSNAMVLNATSAKLTTSPQTPGATYTLMVENIADMAFNLSTAGTSRTFMALDRVAGGLKFDVWFGITGNEVSLLLNDPRYPSSPDLSAYVTQFTSRQVFPDANSMNNYGGRMWGWIVPPEDAQYEFFIRSDDNSQLSLSLDDNPANAVVIATESACCGPFEEPGAPETSAPMSLMAGNRYFIEAIWKEGGGGDYCDVAWRKVGDPTPAINLTFIPGSIVETYAPPGTFTVPTVSFAGPANGSTFEVTDAVTLTANASAGPSKSIVRVEFLEQGKVIGTVSNSPYALTLYDLREDNHTFIARAMDSAGLTTESAPITISVGAQVATITLLAINPVTMWRYDRSGQDLGIEWRSTNYDDTLWPEGATLIADEGTTTVEPIRTRISRFNDQGEYVRTFYFRTHFPFGPVSPSVKLRLRHVVDDGVVFYLNGEEIHRFGIAPGVLVDYLTDAAGHENAYEGPYDIAITNLFEGDNVLAAEVHQAGGSSSDMVFGAELVATVPVIRPVLTIALEGATIRISWTPAGGTLESAPSITGQWSPVANASNPYMTTAAGAPRFYRVNR